MYQNDCNSECILLYQIKTSLKIHFSKKKKQTKKTTTKNPQTNINLSNWAMHIHSSLQDKIVSGCKLKQIRMDEIYYSRIDEKEKQNNLDKSFF